MPRRSPDEEEDELARFMREAEEDEKNYVPIEDRRRIGRENGSSVAMEDNSLLRQASEMRTRLLASDENALKRMKQEHDEALLLKEAEKVASHALQSNQEIASGVRFSESLSPPGGLQGTSSRLPGSDMKRSVGGDISSWKGRTAPLRSRPFGE